MQQKTREREKPEVDKSRRTFCKKAVYAAPVLIVMDQLIHPTETEAGFGPPPSQPAGL